MISTTTIETPLGAMVAAGGERGICLLGYADSQHLTLQLRQISRALGSPIIEGRTELLDELERQLAEYFSGGRKKFDLPLDPIGTGFQKTVWDSLLRIPYGETVSYGEQAAMVGRPTAFRAVAGANGRNKISILVPCHRVIGSDGSLTGYGGGMERKRRLLELEGIHI